MNIIYGYKRTDTPTKGEWSTSRLNGDATANRFSEPVCSVQYGEGCPQTTHAEAVEAVKARLAEEGVTDVTEVFDAVP